MYEYPIKKSLRVRAWFKLNSDAVGFVISVALLAWVYIELGV